MKNELILPATFDPQKIRLARDLFDLAIEMYDPAKIIVFGSQARGDWSRNSDIDFLMIDCLKEKDAGLLLIAASYKKLRIYFDCIVSTTATLLKHQDSPNSVYSRATSEGVAIYARPN